MKAEETCRCPYRSVADFGVAGKEKGKKGEVEILHDKVDVIRLVSNPGIRMSVVDVEGHCWGGYTSGRGRSEPEPTHEE